MSSILNEKWKFLSIAVIGVLATSLIAVAFQLPQQFQDTLFAEQVNVPFGLPSAYGAGALTNVFALPSNNLFKGTGFYNVGFTTATTGTIKTIEITFPAGFSAAGAKLIQSVGMGAGSISISGQVVKYTITTAVSVTAPKAMMIMIGNVVNPAVTSNQVSITTKTAAAAIIDGPTNSATFTLTRVTNSMVQSAIALTGNVTIDSPTFKVDSSHDRIGIGTTTPQGKLDVMGDIMIGSVPNPYAAGSNSLYLTNNFGDPKNNFREAGYADNLYIIGHSDSGAKGTGIVFRTALAGAGESNSVIIRPDGTLSAQSGLTVSGNTYMTGGLTIIGPQTMFQRLYLIDSHASGGSIILKSTDLNCHEIHVDNSGAVFTSAILCPS